MRSNGRGLLGIRARVRGWLRIGRREASVAADGRMRLDPAVRRAGLGLAIGIAAALPMLVSLGAAAETSPQEAKQIFDQMCAGCHGFQGDGGEGHRGGFSPHVGTLANKEYMGQLPDEYLAMIIKKGGAAMGKIATMPAWEHKFNDEQVDALVKHIRTFSPAAH